MFASIVRAQGGTMEAGISKGAQRVAGASGILSLVMSVAGFGLIGAAGFAVQEGTLAEVRGIVSKAAPDQVLAGVYLDFLGSLFFVLFLAGLWARLRTYEPHPAWLSAAALGAGLLAIASSFTDKTFFYGIYSQSGKGLDPTTALVLFAATRASFSLFSIFAAFLAGIVAVAIFRFRPFPVWLGWFGGLVAIAGIAAGATPTSSVAQGSFLLIVIWLLATSISLIRGARPMSEGQT